jgi:hypothetical protein
MESVADSIPGLGIETWGTRHWQRAKGFLVAVSVLFAVVEVAVTALFRH